MIRHGKKIPSDAAQKMPEIVRKMGDDCDVIALFAFGSLVHGGLKPLSDLDLGVLLTGAMDKMQRFDKHLDLLAVFSGVLGADEIDLVIMNDAPDRIVFEVLKTGRLLFCSDQMALVDFRERVVKRYLDFKVKQDAFDAAFLEGVGYHG